MYSNSFVANFKNTTYKKIFKYEKLSFFFIYLNLLGTYLVSYKISVYSENQKKILIKSKIAYKNQVAVVGTPRSDYAFKLRKIAPKELSNFGGCFLTGTAAEVTPVSCIAENKFKVCDMIIDLNESYQALVKKKKAA